MERGDSDSTDSDDSQSPPVAPRLKSAAADGKPRQTYTPSSRDVMCLKRLIADYDEQGARAVADADMEVVRRVWTASGLTAGDLATEKAGILQNFLTNTPPRRPVTARRVAERLLQRYAP